MPKSKEYVEDSDSSGSDEPKAKNRKRKLEESASDDDGDDGNKLIELGKMKFVEVSEFKGRSFVNIREYYGDPSQLKPGKKGIALSIDQWKALKENMKKIDKRIEKL